MEDGEFYGGAVAGAVVEDFFGHLGGLVGRGGERGLGEWMSRLNVTSPQVS